MTTSHIPCAFFPTTVVCIDNHQSFFNHLNQLIYPELRFLHFTNSALAHQHMEQQNTLFHPQTGLLNKGSNQSLIDYEHLLSQLYYADRFHLISAIFANEQMTLMNETTLFECLPTTPTAKILLTDQAIARPSMHATIHRSFSKTNPKLMSLIYQTAIQMNQAFHQKTSLNAIGLYGSPLKLSSTYQRCVEAFIQNNRLIEYYQVDDAGSYVGFDLQGHITWLAVVSDKTLRGYAEAASFENLTPHVTKSLEDKMHLLFLPQQSDKEIDIIHWRQYLFPILGAFKVSKQTYYYTMIHDRWFSLEKEKIMTYHRYMNIHD